MLTNKMPYPPKDGGSIATLSLALALEKCGNDISVLSMNTSKHFFDCASLPNDISSRISFYSEPIDIDIKATKAIKNLLFSRTPYNAERFISKNYKQRLIELLKDNEYDVIQLEGLYLTPYISTIREYSKAKISLRAHNIEHEIWERIALNESNLVKKYYKKNLAKRIRTFKLNHLNQYDFLVPITQRDADAYQQLGNIKPIHVVQTGINTERYIPDTTNTEFPGFFHIGALDWIPNQEGIIWFIDNVWVKFIKKNPEYKFYLAGRNAPDSFVKHIDGKNVEYLGEIDDANAFINSKSVMIVPLLSGSGMRIKIVEGMALGKTIITTTIGTEGINTTNGENILIANNPDEFLNCLYKIHNDKDLHDKISKNAIDFVNKYFNNYNIASELVEFYKKNIYK